MPNHLAALQLRARSLPEMPGVYLWKDSRDRIIYIGKAVNLRSRVSSYFSRAEHDKQARRILQRARTIDFEVTATELDALFRESFLIKEAQPSYNRVLKLPATFYYLKLDHSMPHPYLEIATQTGEDQCLYFGPFRSHDAVRETAQYLHTVLPLRKCTARKPNCRPCIYFQMHTCAAPFISERHQSDHQDAIHQLTHLLDGRSDPIRRGLERQRDHLAEKLDFEGAADSQQRLQSLEELLRKQAILDAAVQCRCVLICQALAVGEESKLFLVGGGQVLSSRLFHAPKTPEVRNWIAAHKPLMMLPRERGRELDLDAARVLERWLGSNRSRVRWIAIPIDAPEEDLENRVRYVLDEGDLRATVNAYD